jgi:hypothetical protein
LQTLSHFLLNLKIKHDCDSTQEKWLWPGMSSWQCYLSRPQAGDNSNVQHRGRA